MNLLPAFLKPKPVHVVPRFHAATKAENRAAAAKAVGIRCQLAVYAATTSDAQRKADTEAHFRRAALGRRG